MPLWRKLSNFEVLLVREDGLDRLFADVLQGVLEVAEGVGPVPRRRERDAFLPREPRDRSTGSLSFLTASSLSRSV